MGKSSKSIPSSLLLRTRNRVLGRQVGSEGAAKLRERGKEFMSWDELTDSQKKEFDWMDEDEQYEARFVKCGNEVWSLGDFMRSSGSPFDGVAADTFFSGVGIKLYPDDRYRAYRLYHLGSHQ